MTRRDQIVWTRRRWPHDLWSIFLLLFWVLMAGIAITEMIHYWYITLPVCMIGVGLGMFGAASHSSGRARRAAKEANRERPLTGPDDFWDGRPS
jgi:hypothetical protein